MSKQNKANNSTPTTRAQHKVQAQESIADDPLGLKALFKISLLKRPAPSSIATAAVAPPTPVTRNRGWTNSPYSLASPMCPQPPRLRPWRGPIWRCCYQFLEPKGMMHFGWVRIKIIELGPLVVQADEEEKVGDGPHGRKEAAPNRSAKVVDELTCFLAQFTSTFWSKEVEANAVYTVTKPSIGATREMIVGNGVCSGNTGGEFCTPGLDSLAVMINAVERWNTKSIASLWELGVNSGMHTIRAKAMVVNVLVGATVAVMALVNDGADGLEVYKIYTRSIGYLVHLPPTYDKSFYLVAALGSVRFPLLASMRLLPNCKERALDIYRIDPKVEDDKEVPTDSAAAISPPSARHAPPPTPAAATSPPTACHTRRASAVATDTGARRLLSKLTAAGSSRRPPPPTVRYSTSTKAVQIASSPLSH
uniref:Uncharacterized protein n=1 Tax=Plectus sambesii TaxID=2011161 RepID=A0A914XQP2_9BILA